MEQATIIKIFLASPSDVKAERAMIFSLRDDLDALIGRPNRIRFEFVNWERSTYPGVGSDAQDVINKNINDDYNVFVGVFWTRFGTPTSRSESGTKEEFQRALSKFRNDPDNNHIMLYFKTGSPANIYEIDIEQFAAVKEFKNELQNQGVYYFEFEKTDDLKNYILLHLAALVRDKYVTSSVDVVKVIESPDDVLDKYELLALQIDEKNSEVAEGLFELLEITMDSLSTLPDTTLIISNAIGFIGNKFVEKTKLVDALRHIKDDRLRNLKVREVADKLAVDLDEYSKELDSLVPEFSSKLNTAIESYTKLLLLASESSQLVNEVETQLATVVPVLSDSLAYVISSISGFLNQLANLPVVTSKFGNAKRRAELITNSLFKEFIKAKRLMEQLPIKGE